MALGEPKHREATPKRLVGQEDADLWVAELRRFRVDRLQALFEHGNQFGLGLVLRRDLHHLTRKPLQPRFAREDGESHVVEVYTLEEDGLSLLILVEVLNEMLFGISLQCVIEETW